MLKMPPTETDTSQMKSFSEYHSYLRGAGKGQNARQPLGSRTFGAVSKATEFVTKRLRHRKRG